jgi:hypothetical protein
VVTAVFPRTGGVYYPSYDDDYDDNDNSNLHPSSTPKPSSTPEASTPPSTQPENTDPFVDVTEADWFYADVQYVFENGLMVGVSESRFAPQTPVTRAMFITTLARFAGVDTSGGETWYAQAVEWAVAQGISDGSSLDTDITREQLITMLWRLAGSPAVSGTLSFADADGVSDYAQTALLWAVEQGIINGYEDGTLRPKAPATRAVVAAIVRRFAA